MRRGASLETGPLAGQRLRRRRGEGQCLPHLLSRQAPRTHEKARLLLGQGKVEALRCLGARRHGNAEASRSGTGAVHRNEEQPSPARSVVRVGIATLEKDAVLHGQGREITSAHADHGELRGVGERLLRAKGTAVRLDLEKFFPGGEDIGLERSGAVHHVEKRVAPVGLDPVAPRLLSLAQPARQLLHGADLVEHHRPVPRHGAYHPVAPRPQGVQQTLEVGARKELCGCGLRPSHVPLRERRWCGNRTRERRRRESAARRSRTGSSGGPFLFDGDAFREVPRLVHIRPLQHRHVIGKELERDGCENGGQVLP